MFKYSTIKERHNYNPRSQPDEIVGTATKNSNVSLLALFVVEPVFADMRNANLEQWAPFFYG